MIGLKFPPSPPEALPQKTFADTYKLALNGETVSMMHVAPAHTDTDIMVHFPKANVLQTGDVCFNGIYPYIDAGTGGSISGMIAASNKILAMTDANTKSFLAMVRWPRAQTSSGFATCWLPPATAFPS